jgi:hypothetical protein
METRHLPCALTRSEVEERADKLARLVKDRDAIDAERKQVARDYKTRMDDLSKEIGQLSEQVRSKREWRDVECTKERNEERGTVDFVRVDTGEVVESRALHPDERQVKLFDAQYSAPHTPQPAGNEEAGA